jgi:hypothetical protein
MHPLVGDYLRALESAARGLPRRERDELVAEISGHIDEALPDAPTEADIRNVLDQLGPPADIVAAARPEGAPVRRGAREVFALILLVTGLPPVLGWLVGLGLLIWSPLWSGRQKLLGALVWPGGWLGVLILASVPSSEHACRTDTVSSQGVVLTHGTCTGSSASWVWGLVVLTAAVVAPLIVAAYLYRAAGRRSGL